MKNRQNKK
ncbi:hypothetical protein MTR67_023722 [Solanum verrucosum]|uniref:Uncharacterized protein n=1 Tax=Solanum verrucosum TaxID=315347 RepID=A0AAF0TRP2_SOLVR|nr:hypothetical protein MTR67_023722 [Solanum verrucosum]